MNPYQNPTPHLTEPWLANKLTHERTDERTVERMNKQVEAELGFMTAAAFDGKDAVAWDSGGGSFQICAQDPATAELRTYLGALGTGIGSFP